VALARSGTQSQLRHRYDAHREGEHAAVRRTDGQRHLLRPRWGARDRKIGTNGVATYPVASIPKGTNSYTAKYAATANYAASYSY